MAHTYATLAEFKKYLRDQGDTLLGANNDALYLSFVEDASRSVDDHCRRTDYAFPMSGFGPRTGTNRYDGISLYADSYQLAGTCLKLGDDLLSITSVTVRDSPTGATRTLTDETHFLKVPYDRTPYRELVIHEDSSATWGLGHRGNDVAGKWGYQDVRDSLTATAAIILTTTETTVTVSAAAEFSAGQTLLIGSEQLYVRSTATTVLTVDRGVNGTTAAAHGAAAAISLYRYPQQVYTTTLRLAHRRWRTRDSGVTGADGSGDVPMHPMLDSERSILVRGLWSFAMPEAG